MHAFAALSSVSGSVHHHAEPEVLQNIARAILPLKDGKYTPAQPPLHLTQLTDYDLLVAMDAVWKVAEEAKPKPSGKATYRLLAWTVAYARSTMKPLDMYTAEKVGKRLAAQALKVRGTFSEDRSKARDAAATDATLAPGLPAALAAIDEAERAAMAAARLEVYIGFHELEPPLPRPPPPPRPAPLPPLRSLQPPPERDADDDPEALRLELEVLRAESEACDARFQAMLLASQKFEFQSFIDCSQQQSEAARRALEIAKTAQDKAAQFAGFVIECTEQFLAQDLELERAGHLLEKAELAQMVLTRDLKHVTAERDAYRAELDVLRRAAAPGPSAEAPPIPERNPARSPARGSPSRTPKPSPSRSLSAVLGAVSVLGRRSDDQ